MPFRASFDLRSLLAAAAVPARPGVPEYSASGAPARKCETNPPEHSGTSPLTYRQLAAARFLARGRGSVETARRLGVTRHTVARWKHDAVFIAEVERVRARLDRAAAAPLRSFV